MKTRHAHDVKSTFGDEFESNDFAVEVNGTTFDVLFDSLYENKPRAVIRELWTNAYDSHVEAGCEAEPFHCQLPSKLDPTFSVRDYGVGMDDATARHLYTTAFASTKRSTNDVVGCLGLGSKSPFAYTDAFTVRCFGDGRVRTYLAARGEDGTPTFTRLSDVETDQPRGVEVSFPVKFEDFHRFAEEAKNVAHGFDVKPTVPGITFAETEVTHAGPGWRIISDVYAASVAIRQGCVIYPLHDRLKPAVLQYHQQLVVDVPIGTANVAANRESLSLDDTTRENVRAAFEEAEEDIARYIDARFAEAESEFDANVTYRNLESSFFLGKRTYRGRPLSGVIQFKAADLPTMLDKKLKLISGHLSVHVNEAPRVTFVIDRSLKEGERPIPRKTTRWRAWRDRQDGRVYVLVDPTSRQLRHLAKRLRLRPHQLISMRSLPDVEIERKPRKKADRIGGVVWLNGTSQYVDELPKDYAWMEVPRYTGNDWNLKSFGTAWSRDAALSTICGLMLLTEEKLPVLVMTPGAVKRFKPAADRNFFARAEKWFMDNADDVLEAYHLTRLAKLVRNDSHLYGLEDEVIDAVLADHHAQATSVTVEHEVFVTIQRLMPDRIRVVNEQVDTDLEEVKKTFPMLFETDNEALLKYVAAVRKG